MARAVAALAIAAMLHAGSAFPSAGAPPEKLEVCLGCHGADGQSETAKVPSLGGLPAKYVVIQLFMFREGLRAVEPMTSLTKGWSDDELQRAADFITALPPPKPPKGQSDPARMERAHTLVEQNHCNICHRLDFSGQENVPRLADQRQDYLEKSLREYKSGARHGYDATMAEVIQSVNDQQMAELAYYLSHLR